MNKGNEVTPMTNEQSAKLEILARLDELDRLAGHTNDPATLEAIAERKKVLRLALQSI